MNDAARTCKVAGVRRRRFNVTMIVRDGSSERGRLKDEVKHWKDSLDGAGWVVWCDSWCLGRTAFKAGSCKPQAPSHPATTGTMCIVVQNDIKDTIPRQHFLSSLTSSNWPLFASFADI